MKPAALFLFDKTAVMADPWAAAGYDCYCVDIQHPKGEARDGNIIRVGADIHRWMPPLNRQFAFGAAFTPCTDVAVSGARWFAGKGLYALSDAIALFARSVAILEALDAPWMIENPASVISSYWRKPDHIFDPWQFTGFELGDNYNKTTWIWCGGGFVMPAPFIDPSAGEPDDRIWRAPPGDERANFRSATPRGFAIATHLANDPGLKREAA
jgi:hypothetical protein